jgi:hypothetical protein
MIVPIRVLVALCGVFAFLAGGTALEAQTTLKYRFKQGDTIRYLLTATQKGTTKAKDNEFTVVNKQFLETTWKVESVNDKGDARIRIKYDRAKLTADNGKEMAEGSSDAKEDPTTDPAKGMTLMAKALAKFEGTFIMTPQGEIKDAMILPESLKEIKAIPGADKIAEGWSAETLGRTLKDNTLALPADAVTKGKTWKHEVSGQTQYGKVSGDLVYVYDGVVDRDGGKAEKFLVKPKLKIETDPKAKPPLTIKTFESEGTAYFDNAAGKLLEVSTSQRIEVQVEVEGTVFSQKTEVSNSLKLAK